MRLGTNYIFWKLRNSSFYNRAKSYYYRNKNYEVYSYDAHINPFKTVFVSPSQINRFTGRPLPLWRHKEVHIGEVQKGDWDRNSDLIIEDDHDHEERRWLYELIFSGRYDDTVFHRSFVQHFENNVKWEETEFIKKNIQKIEKTHKTRKTKIDIAYVQCMVTKITSRTTLPFHDESKTVQNRDDTFLLTVKYKNYFT